MSSCPAIVFSSLLWVLGFRQTKTCQAKWTLIAFKPKLSAFCRALNGYLALETATRPQLETLPSLTCQTSTMACLLLKNRSVYLVNHYLRHLSIWNAFSPLFMMFINKTPISFELVSFVCLPLPFLKWEFHECFLVASQLHHRRDVGRDEVLYFIILHIFWWIFHVEKSSMPYLKL